jgi:cobalamin-dependent methionine synthase I
LEVNGVLIVGERINTSRKIKGEPVIENAVMNRDAEYIKDLARKQFEAGATYIDVNAGTLTSGEPEALEWLTKVVMEAVDAPISFDTPNPQALDMAMKAYDPSKGQPMVNSITAETERYANVLPYVVDYKAKVIALAMDDSGIQQDPEKRLSVARTLVDNLTSAGVALDDIYVDPLTFPIGTGSDVGLSMLDIIEKIMTEYPGVHTIAGVSNISHGMPARKLLNQAMTVLAMGKGLDAGIIDPNDRYLMALIASAEALLGRDEYSMNYITLSRAGAFEGL